LPSLSGRARYVVLAVILLVGAGIGWRFFTPSPQQEVPVVERVRRAPVVRTQVPKKQEEKAPGPVEGVAKHTDPFTPLVVERKQAAVPPKVTPGKPEVPAPPVPAVVLPPPPPPVSTSAGVGQAPAQIPSPPQTGAKPAPPGGAPAAPAAAQAGTPTPGGRQEAAPPKKAVPEVLGVISKEGASVVILRVDGKTYVAGEGEEVVPGVKVVRASAVDGEVVLLVDGEEHRVSVSGR
jgi:hypothetical protein